MNRRQAKIEALKMAAHAIHNLINSGAVHDSTILRPPEEPMKVERALIQIVDRLEDRYTDLEERG